MSVGAVGGAGGAAASGGGAGAAASGATPSVGGASVAQGASGGAIGGSGEAGGGGPEVGKAGDSKHAINININNSNMSTQDMVGLQNNHSCQRVGGASAAYEAGGQQEGFDLKKLLEMMMMIKMMQEMMGQQ